MSNFELKSLSMLTLTETDICDFWTECDAFIESVNKNKFNSEYMFFEGPPFATGLPHYGHILAGLIKDTITRYHNNLGKSVARIAGFDTHGLPIEYEIEKDLGIKTIQQVLDYGIGPYNEACKSIVMKYSTEWESQMHRLGRWIDFKNKYATMDKNFMNSVWWVFNQLYKKNRLYEGVKIMGFSTSCGTPLSNSEIQQNYQEISDDSLFVKFKLKNTFKTYSNVFLIIWTTTPWTLPSNYVVCINQTQTYALVEFDNQFFVITEKLIDNVFKSVKSAKYDILLTFLGSDLIGLEYQPPFDFNIFNNNYVIIHGDFVTDSDGTGIVHIAPSFGSDDYDICIKHQIIQKDTKLFLPLDSNGYVNDLIFDLKGMFYKNFKSSNNKSDEKLQMDLNTWVIIELKKLNLYWDKRTFMHNYPFCWRSDTPLIYRAVNSWFVKVEDMREQLCNLNANINWIPESVGSGRFHNWLANAKDWCVSRNRFWGTPIPIWKSSDGDIICMESSYELELYANLKPNSLKDLHRHHIDQIEFEYQGKFYKRIPEVLDCWFESGAMPYCTVGQIGILELLHTKCNNAMSGLLFDNNINTSHPYILTDEGNTYKILPADFIAEGLDQTRGWFYTLLVLSASLFNQIPFSNVIVNGLILAEDGKKMSKRLKNYPDPMDIVNIYGSDALRLYLLQSPATYAEPLKFSKSGVHDVSKDILIQLTNSIVLWKECVQIYLLNNSDVIQSNLLFDPTTNINLITNPINMWLLIKYKQLRDEYFLTMNLYDLSSSVKVLYKLIQILNNGYIKFGKSLLKNKDSNDQTIQALSTLRYVINYILDDFKAIIPFFSEARHQELYQFDQHIELLIRNQFVQSEQIVKTTKSIHLITFKHYLNLSTEQIKHSNDFDIIYNIITNIIQLRSINNIGIKRPIKTVQLIIDEQLNSTFGNQYCNHFNVIIEQCNLLNIEIINKSDVLINQSICPIKGLIFKKYGKNIMPIYNKLSMLSNSELFDVYNSGIFMGQIFDQSMFNVKSNVVFISNNNDQSNQTNFIFKNFKYDQFNIMILMDIFDDPNIDKLYYYRLVANSIQLSRKYAQLKPWNQIQSYWMGDPKYSLESSDAIEYIEKITKIKLIKLDQKKSIDITHEFYFENIKLTIILDD